MLKWDRNRKSAKSLLDRIGYTPMVRLNRVATDVEPEICVKLEYFSPSGSLKDRIYLNMIERAERRGDLKKGMTILECSTGNAGYLRKHHKKVKLYAGEPAECPLLSRREWGEHKIEGIGDGFVPRDLDLSLLSGVITITSNEAIEMARRLSREEGIFCGISS